MTTSVLSPLHFFIYFIFETFSKTFFHFFEKLFLIPLRDWAHVGVVLCELPTASSHFGSTGVLWALTGTHPCGPPSRMMEVTRAPVLCGLWSWRAVVKWSCGVIERCGIRVYLNTPPLATTIAQSGCQSEIVLQVSL